MQRPISKKLGGKESSEDYKKVMQAVREHIFRNHKFPSASQIAKITGISKSKCKSVCNQLARQNQLYIVFGGGKGLPVIVLPYDMMQGVLRTQARPKWIDKFGFKEKNKLDREIEQLNKKISVYEMFERLLYTEDVPLEEAVAFTLDWLFFNNVRHHKENPDNPDITFDHNGKLVLVEVEGTTKAGDKSKVLQLDGWIRREIELRGKKREELIGVFVVNHYREIEPNKRSAPLTRHAKEFLKHYGFQFFTTSFLFDIVKQVTNGLSKEKAREAVLKGERIG